MPTLYSTDLSPPCRAVLLTAKALGIDLKIKEINLLKMDNLNPKFLEMNPQHSVPTLDDSGYIFWDSHAINAYLVQKYGADDTLYPTDVKQRALVDQRLHFDSGSVYPFVHRIIKLIKFLGIKTIPDEQANDINDMYKLFETLLIGNKWVAGERITIADFSLVTSITSLDTLVPLTPEKYPSITKWITRCQALPYYDINKKGLADFKEFIQILMSLN